MSDNLARRLKLLLKLAFTAGALWYVLAKIDTRILMQTLQRAEWGWTLLGLLFFNLSKIASAWRLNLLFEAIGLRLSNLYNLKLYYVGMFYNLFLPGGIGGDGYKMFLLNRHKKIAVKSLFSALLYDRLSGLTALLFYALLLFYASNYTRYLGPLGGQIALITAILVFPVAYIATARFFKAFVHAFLPLMGWGLAVQALQIASALCLLTALGIGEYRLEYLTLFLLSSVAAVLPLSVGGVGVRELTFLYGLQAIGQPPEEGVTFSFLFFLVTLVSSLGGLAFVKNIARTKEPNP